VFAGCCGMALLAVSLIQAFFALWFRIDSPGDRAFIWVMDPLLGLLFATAVLLLGGARKSTLATFAQVVSTWVLVSGFFLFWHEAQVRVRWTEPRRFVAQRRVKTALVALEEYARDCGGFPPEDKGLGALHTDPGVAGWAGPYLKPENLTDPWGNSLEYRVRGDRVEVWSNGPDGKGGTEDDIRLEHTEHDEVER
jgi:Type II secretion system (T2SS), protein G